MAFWPSTTFGTRSRHHLLSLPTDVLLGHILPLALAITSRGAWLCVSHTTRYLVLNLLDVRHRPTTLAIVFGQPDNSPDIRHIVDHSWVIRISNLMESIPHKWCRCCPTPTFINLLQHLDTLLRGLNISEYHLKNISALHITWPKIWAPTVFAQLPTPDRRHDYITADGDDFVVTNWSVSTLRRWFLPTPPS